ncbi:MAG: HAD family hydrolase [Candidatus Omnitrophica bacterium]|nr:HAD family hydrolase [Candidatus Omnitrophota bacterium]
MALIKLTVQQVKEDAEQQLRGFRKTKDFLVAIDTDGCITDNMNGKQMLIFHPQFMEFYSLWGIESYFREVAEYYNLFSKERGCNRFIAVQLTLKALAKREDVNRVLSEKDVKLPDTASLNKYINDAQENKLGLGNPSLEGFLDKNPTDLSLYKLLGWSEAVNRTFPHISAKIPPFDNVKESLQLMSQSADIMVVSKTPYRDLADYWETQGIAGDVQIIAGQEMGSKGHHIEVAKKAGGYGDNQIMMIGDGKGDLKAVKANNGLFYSTPPGKEQKAWNEFPRAFEMFTRGKYRGEFEKHLLTAFDKAFLTEPAWEKPGYNHISAYRENQEIRKTLYGKFNPGGKLLIL